MYRVAIAIALAAACKKSTPQPAEGTAEGSHRAGDTVAVAAPSGASHADWIKPTKQIAWSRPSRPRNNQEDLLYGTWAGKVGDYATRSAFMADRVMLSLAGSGDLVSRVSEAIANDHKVTTSCVWLELRPDFTGFRRECAVVNGEPSALDENDFATGKKKDLGTRLEWFIDDKDGNTLKIHFAADMVVPALRDGTLRHLVFRDWWLKLDKSAGDNTFAVVERIPEHDYTLPTKYAYQIFSQKFLGE